MKSWLNRRSASPTAAAVYGRIVAQARQPAFYLRFGVPDSLNGRFELLALHLFLVLHRLGRERAHAGCAALSQALVDLTMADLDANLREMGAGDLGVGRRVKNMAGALYARIADYGAALDTDGDLGPALARHLYGTAATAATPDRLAALSGYVGHCREVLNGRDAAALAAGAIDFPAPSAEPGKH